MEQRGVAIWFTGLSGSGKSTLARALEARIKERGLKVEVLDGDEIRKNLSHGLGYSREDRDTNLRRIGFVAKLLTRNGIVVITATISPYRELRNDHRQNIGSFVEVYCRCPLEVVERRDVKGLYKKARRGEITLFTGIDDPYEEPLHAEIVIDTDKETVTESSEKIWQALQGLGYVSCFW